MSVAAARARGAAGRPSGAGIWAHLSCLIFALVVTLLADGAAVVVASLLVVGLAVVLCPAALDPLKSRRFWLFLAFLSVPAALWGGAPTWRLLGLGISREGLLAGGEMGLRALAILVAVTGFAASVSVTTLAGLLERAGLKGLGFALGVAVNMLPIVRDTATTTYYTLRLRGGFRRQRLRGIRLLLVTVVANSLRRAEDIVCAAEARAFSMSCTRPVPIPFGRADLALCCFLLATGVVLLTL